MENQKACHQCHSFQTTGFHLLSPESQARLTQMKQSRFFKKHEVLFSQGEVVPYLYCLRSGLIKLESVGEDGHSITVGFLQGGDILGLSGVLAKSPSAVSAVAIEDTYACTFPAEFFHSILADTPKLAMQYLTSVMGELRETRQRLLSGVDKDVASRVAEALVYLKTHYPDHNFTRREIAEWAGTTTESVIRTLSQFEDDGIIAQSGRRIQITDASRLTSSAGLLF